jgi:hypothetical protein
MASTFKIIQYGVWLKKDNILTCEIADYSNNNTQAVIFCWQYEPTSRVTVSFDFIFSDGTRKSGLEYYSGASTVKPGVAGTCSDWQLHESNKTLERFVINSITPSDDTNYFYKYGNSIT